MKIFISSVQREFAGVRSHLKRFVAKSPAYRRLMETFVFEFDVVSQNRRADEVYIDELRKCDVYLGLIGREYGFEDAEGFSPTEREYDEATRLGIPRLIFILGREGETRHPKEEAFIRRVSAEVIRSRCDDESSLILEICSSIDGLLLERGAFRIGPFDASPCDDAALDDIDDEKVAWFVNMARTLRNADLQVGMSTETVLRHLHLLVGRIGELTNAAILLFGKDPQQFHISSEVKCVQWHGVERHKPMLSYQIFKGTLFDMADAAIAFVLSKINLAVGTRANGSLAPRQYEIPQSAIAEAIINAIAHRDYKSSGSVQVEVFADRVVIRNPGKINPALTKEELFEEHTSFPNNPKIADSLYQVKYIEKFGTGFTDLVNDCRAAGLPDPIVDDSGEFTITIFRPEVHGDNYGDNYGDNHGDKPGLTQQQKLVLRLLEENATISIRDMAERMGLRRRTIETHIAALKKRGVIAREGGTRGYWRVIVQEARNDES